MKIWNGVEGMGALLALCGVLACGGGETSTAVDAAAGCEGAENACGGCELLGASLGDPCGTCDTGMFACDGTDGLVCAGDEGAGAMNACGGCTTLDTTTLDDACGRCDLGSIACDGLDAIACQEPAAASACVALPANAVAWWRAEADGTDSVGNIDGSLNGGAQIVTGLVGNAFSLVADQAVAFGNITALDFVDTEFTVEGWVRHSQLPPDKNIAGCNPHYPVFTNDAWGWTLQVSETGTVAFSKYTDINGGEGVTGESLISLDTWHHVAGVFGATEMRVYLDGRLEGAQTLASTTIFYNTNDEPSMGDRQCGVGVLDVIGELDEFAIYSRALSTAELQGICEADSFGKCVP